MEVLFPHCVVLEELGRTKELCLQIVRLQGVKKDYHLESKSLPVLRGVSLDVERGEIIAVIGRSGVGRRRSSVYVKSTR